ncbi:hypothetical protein [Secundilactobacillus kimchicus]|uniref:hypothetical protein n=1 Tax=Secundilactobacillus kimchicus TaxID=528209 RepID=UPI0006D2CA80|nr:hypothetical protein [Secundilactobacillus kimchicus]
MLLKQNGFFSTNDDSIKLEITITSLSSTPIKIKEISFLDSDLRSISEIYYNYEIAQENWIADQIEERLNRLVKQETTSKRINTFNTGGTLIALPTMETSDSNLNSSETLSNLSAKSRHTLENWKSFKRIQIREHLLEEIDQSDDSEHNINKSASTPLIGTEVIGSAATKTFTYWFSSQNIPTRMVMMYLGKIWGFTHRKKIPYSKPKRTISRITQ